MHSEPMIAVRDVRASSRWYTELLEANNDHDRDDFDRVIADGKVVLMLHHWDIDHGAFSKTPLSNPGTGFLLWIFTDRLETIRKQAAIMDVEVVKEPWKNERAGWREFTLVDPDGYRVAIAQFE